MKCTFWWRDGIEAKQQLDEGMEETCRTNEKINGLFRCPALAKDTFMCAILFPLSSLVLLSSAVT